MESLFIHPTRPGFRGRAFKYPPLIYAGINYQPRWSMHFSTQNGANPYSPPPPTTHLPCTPDPTLKLILLWPFLHATPTCSLKIVLTAHWTNKPDLIWNNTAVKIRLPSERHSCIPLDSRCEGWCDRRTFHPGRALYGGKKKKNIFLKTFACTLSSCCLTELMRPWNAQLSYGCAWCDMFRPGLKNKE